jgi:Lipocalin-like domain
MKTSLAILLLAICSLGQTSSLAVPTVAQLVGSWRLVSVEITLKDGTVKPDDRFGPHARGYIMYEPDGHMCAEIMNPDRPTWKNPDKPSDEEKITAFDGFIAYCGAYKLDAEHSTVTHYPEVAEKPPYVGSTQPRPFKIEGKRLIITPASTDTNVAKRVLIWERAE